MKAAQKKMKAAQEQIKDELRVNVKKIREEFTVQS